MIRAAALSALAAAALAVAAPDPARAGAGPEARLPVVAVALDRAPTAAEIDGVVAAVGAPVLDADGLARALGIADPGDAADPGALEASHAAAVEAFFSGDHVAAAASWEALDRALAARPGLFARRPALLRVAFEARLYLALCARGAGDEAGVDGWIAAAARIEDLEPSAPDFPPWIRDRLSRERAAGVPRGVLSFVDAVDCELWIDGRLAGAGPGAYPVARGRHAVAGRCQGARGPVREIEVGEGEVRIPALALRHSVLVREGGLWSLAAAPGASGEGIAADLSTLAGAAGARRALAVVGRRDGVELLLVEEGTVLRSRSVRSGDADALAAAMGGLAGPPARPAPAAAPGPARPWYGDGLAWGLLASGLAVWGAGLGLGQACGSNSPQEPAAWAMMAGGAVVAATGGVLFFVPAAAPSGEGGAAVGIAGGARF